MQKNILFSILLSAFTLGLYGCSCSQATKAITDLAPGLYLSELSVNEGDSQSSVPMSVTLQRENSDTVTVTYTVSAIDPTGKTAEEIATYAIVGTADTPNVDVIATTGTVTFSGGSNVVTFNIPIVGDDIYEYDEKFLVTLSAASDGVNIVDGSVIAVIKNDDKAPTASMALINASDAALSEMYSGPGETIPRTSFVVSLDKASRVDGHFYINGSIEPSTPNTGAKTEIGKTATYRVDYFLYKDGERLSESEGVTIAAGETEATIELEVVDDGIPENEEQFYLTLAAKADLSVGVQGVELAFSITDNDSAAQKIIPVNDTGLQQLVSFGLADATEEAALEAEMDASIGLDSVVSPVKTGGGRAGFDYSKIDANGQTVDVSLTPITDSDGNVTIPWDCVKDNVSGLVWEVKTRGNVGKRAESHEFYWYDPNYSTNGGDAGERGSAVCSDNGLDKNCNTAFYIADMNAEKLCGMTGWRLPTIEELRSIADYGVSAESGVSIPGEDVITIALDTDFFAGDVRAVGYYWSSDTDTASLERARAFNFRTPTKEESRLKNGFTLGTIRLVNDSLAQTQTVQ